MTEILNRIERIKKPTEQEAEEAGRDAAKNRPNDNNCHFKYFRSQELTEAWQRGHDQETQ